MGKFIDKIKRLFGWKERNIGVIASVGGPETGQNDFWDKTEMTVVPQSEPDVLFQECGHYGPSKVRIIFWNLSFSPELKDEMIKMANGCKTAEAKCPNCMLELLRKHAIRCCLCGGAILPGEPVALYSGGRGINKKMATRVGKEFVGCLAWECCPSGGFFSGHWSQDGFKPTFASGNSVAAEVFATGKAIVGTTDDPPTIKTIEPSEPTPEK